VTILEKLPRSVKIDPVFALRNAAVWISFMAILTVLNVTMHNRNLMLELKGNAGLLVCCLVGSYLLKMFISSAGEEAPWRSVYIHAFFIGVPIAALLMTVLSMEIHALFITEDHPDPQLSMIRIFFGVLFFMLILFSGWSGIYVSILAVKRSNLAEVSRLETETALREAELRVLKAQINPHFLFNSLNTIRALVNEHPERAQDAVLHLSLLLRAALQSESLLRPLREELVTARHYLVLEQFRFEERLRVREEVPAAMMDVQVPTMLVQILVENAVKYGIAAEVGGGELSIVGTIDGDYCRIAISNPGKLKPSRGSTGLGLRNARMRLDSLVGPSASIDLAETNGTVTATITIPYRRITA